MKIKIAQDQQTTCNGIAVFQKFRQLFNKQEIGKFIFVIRWGSVETELDTRILSSGRYMIQFNVCPCVRLWRFTDCAKLKILSRSRILDIC